MRYWFLKVSASRWKLPFANVKIEFTAIETNILLWFKHFTLYRVYHFDIYILVIAYVKRLLFKNKNK